MVLAHLEPASSEGVSNKERKTIASNLTGTTASSLHRVKGFDNQDIAIFVFPDLTIKAEGTYRLHFVLMVMEESPEADVGTWLSITDCYSTEFTVHSARAYPGMAESTPLTRSFADQGVRLRLRKDSRQLTTKKQNHHTAARIGQKRVREPSPDNNNDDHIAPVAHRHSIPTPRRPYYEESQGYVAESDGKRQRTASAPFAGRQTHTNVPVSYAAMNSIGAQQNIFQTQSGSSPSGFSHTHQPQNFSGPNVGSTGPPHSESLPIDSQYPQTYGNPSFYEPPENYAPSTGFFAPQPQSYHASSLGQGQGVLRDQGMLLHPSLQHRQFSASNSYSTSPMTAMSHGLHYSNATTSSG